MIHVKNSIKEEFRNLYSISDSLLCNKMSNSVLIVVDEFVTKPYVSTCKDSSGVLFVNLRDFKHVYNLIQASGNHYNDETNVFINNVMLKLKGWNRLT